LAKSSSRALEAPKLEIIIFMKGIDKETIGFRQGAHIGKFSSRALEGPRLEISAFIHGVDKEMIGWGQGAQTGKSSSRALAAPSLSMPSDKNYCHLMLHLSLLELAFGKLVQ